MEMIASRCAFEAVKAWAEDARLCTRDNPPDTARLRELLPEGTERAILRAETATYDDAEHKGRTVIEFDIVGEKRVGQKTRFVLPVHFAVLRALELVPGMVVRMKDDPHRMTAEGVEKREDQLHFHLSLRVFPAKKKKLGTLSSTRLDRILFNVSDEAELHERRTGDYRYIVPSGYVPLLEGEGGYLGQDAVLSAVIKLVGDEKPGSVSFTGLEMVSVLASLFKTADAWHWDELIDRLDADKGNPHRLS